MSNECFTLCVCDNSKERGHVQLEPGDPTCTDWRIYWLLPFVFLFFHDRRKK